MDNNNLKISSYNNKNKNLELKNNKPIKLIKTNRAECHYLNDDDDFNLKDFIIEDFFSSEKAIKLKREENMINEKERNKIFSNFMPAVKCLKRIKEDEEEEKEEIVPENINPNNNLSLKKKINNGALYEYFYSEKFNIDLLIIYLNKINNIAIIDTLIELMYEKYINQSLFYLPQLCMFFNYKEYFSSIKSYLLDRCVDQIKFSLQITWLLNSFIEDETPLIKGDIYEGLLQKIEETLVNGERNTIKLFNQYIELQKEETNKFSINNYNSRISKDKDMLPFLEKQSRLVYFNICNDFYSDLKNMCEDLRNYQKENGERKNKLLEYIKNFNDNFIQQRKDNEDYLLNYPSFFGIILPFNDSSSAEDIDSSLIVRIIPEECFCFSTKARVPTKICAECIQVKELKNSEYLNNNSKSKKINKLKRFDTYKENDDTNKFAFPQRKESFNVRQSSILARQNTNRVDCFRSTRIVAFQEKEKEREEEDKAKQLKIFLYNINNIAEEEKETDDKKNL